MDFYLGLPLNESQTTDEIRSPHIALLRLLDFAVAVMLDGNSGLTRSHHGRASNARDARVFEAIETLKTAIWSVVQSTIVSLNRISLEVSR